MIYWLCRGPSTCTEIPGQMMDQVFIHTHTHTQTHTHTHPHTHTHRKHTHKHTHTQIKHTHRQHSHTQQHTHTHKHSTHTHRHTHTDTDTDTDTDTHTLTTLTLTHYPSTHLPICRTVKLIIPPHFLIHPFIFLKEFNLAPRQGGLIHSKACGMERERGRKRGALKRGGEERGRGGRGEKEEACPPEWRAAGGLRPDVWRES